MNKFLKTTLRILFYWIVAMMTSSFVISFISCFLPPENLKSYFTYGFNSNSLIYFKLTFLFYLLVSGFIAIPGFLITLALYLTEIKLFKNYRRALSIFVNLMIGALVLFIYNRLNITNKSDFICFIVPSYIISIFIFGFFMLPNPKK